MTEITFSGAPALNPPDLRGPIASAGTAPIRGRAAWGTCSQPTAAVRAAVAGRVPARHVEG